MDVEPKVSSADEDATNVIDIDSNVIDIDSPRVKTHMTILKAAKVAVQTNNFDLFQELCKTNLMINTCACEDAARHGRLDMVKWYHDNMPSMREYVCHRNTLLPALVQGHLNVGKWLLENGTEITNSDLDFAACRSYFDIIKYVRENNYIKDPFDPRFPLSCGEFVSAGMFDEARYIIDNFSYRMVLCTNTVDTDHNIISSWIHANLPPNVNEPSNSDRSYIARCSHSQPFPNLPMNHITFCQSKRCCMEKRGDCCVPWP